MRHSIFVVCIILVAFLTIVPCVQANKINLSIVSFKSGISIGDIEGFSSVGPSGLSTVTSYTYNVKKGNTIDSSTFETENNGDYNIVYTFADNSAIIVTYNFFPTSLVTGTAIMKVGSNSTSFIYYRIPGISDVSMRPIVLQAGVDPTSHIEYLVASNTIDLPSNNAAYYQFDDSNAAYVPLNTRLSVNPIIQISSFSDGGSYTITGNAISTKNYQSAEIAAETKPRNTLLDQLGLGVIETVVEDIKAMIDQFTTFAVSAASIISLITSLGTWIFAGEFFLGINVFYMSIAAVLSIEDSDDIFKSFGSFMRRMRMLLRFYMEIYNDIRKFIFPWIT
jgi:hypothetical protein